MTRAWLIGAAALALTSSLVLAQDAPTDLLPPGFDQPAPTPTPTSTARPTAAPAPGAPQPAATRSGEIVQPLPSNTPAPAPSAGRSEVDLSGLPTLRELEAMTTDELDELFGLRPTIDIPPGARRSMERVGIIGASEGGLPPGSLANQPAALVRAILTGIEGPLVSRWGHILLRRALASRLAAPEGMDPAEFAALRASLLNRIGEHVAARALVQDVDTANYTPALTDAAIDAYVGTADIVGACPAVRLGPSDREDPQWRMLAGICNAYAGEETRAQDDLRRALSRGQGERIDVLLAQRFAGAAGRGRRAVTIEWEGIEEMTPWRYALATALGETIPEGLADDLGPYYQRIAATAPMFAPAERAEGAALAASLGILSSAALVDLYSQIYAYGESESDAGLTASKLRQAYVGATPAARMEAIRQLWAAAGDHPYSGQILTAYAAARLAPSEELAEDAGPLIASMLTAGLDRDALRWADVVEDGSQGWALLALARPGGDVSVSESDLGDYIDADASANQRKSRMLVAGLAGLGRIDEGAVGSYSSQLGVSLTAQTRWTRTIEKAAAVDNTALVALLAGLGMQGESWDRMTARHLYHTVRALARVGLEAEARMIAAEAVARA